MPFWRLCGEIGTAVALDHGEEAGIEENWLRHLLPFCLVQAGAQGMPPAAESFTDCSYCSMAPIQLGERMLYDRTGCANSLNEFFGRAFFNEILNCAGFQHG